MRARSCGLPLLLLVPALLGVGIAPAWAAPQLEAEVGYARLYAPARPLPVQVHLSSAAGEPAFKGALLLEAWQEEGGAPRCIHALREVELGPGSAKSYLLGFRPDRSKGVRLRLYDAKGEAVAEKVFAYGVEIEELPPGVPLVGTLRVPEGRTPLYWPRGYQHYGPKDESPPTGAAAVEVGPELLASGGLEGLSGLVIGVGQSLEGAQLSALQAWVREGGQLLIGPGSRPLDEDHPLGPLLPFSAKSQRRVRGAVSEFDSSGGDGSASLLTGVVRQGAWVTHAAPDGTPVLVTRALGRGRVTLCTASLQSPALGSEEVREGLFERAFVLSPVQPRGAGRVDVLEQVSLQGNLERAKSEVDRTWIALLILLFLFVVGPLDYFLWRWRPGPRMTWVNLTVSSLGFSALAFLVGTRGTGPGLEERSTWIVDCSPDGSAVVDGSLVVAGRRHSSFAIKGPGLRFYPSGTPEASEARLQGDLLLGEGEVRFNLGLGACLPLRIRGRAEGIEPPIRVERLGPQRIQIERVSDRSAVEVFVITSRGYLQTHLVDRKVVVLDMLPEHSRIELPLVDEDGLMHQTAAVGVPWTTAAQTMVEQCQPAGFGGFSAFNDAVAGVGWGLDRSAWLARGHVVVVAKVRETPALLQGKDLPQNAAQSGWTYYRIHLAPEREVLAPDSAQSDDAKSEDAKSDEAKSEDAKSDDTKSDDAKSDDAKSEDAKSEDAKSEEVGFRRSRPRRQTRDQGKPA